MLLPRAVSVLSISNIYIGTHRENHTVNENRNYLERINMIEKTRRTYLTPNHSGEVFWKGKKGRGV